MYHNVLLNNDSLRCQQRMTGMCHITRTDGWHWSSVDMIDYFRGLDYTVYSETRPSCQTGHDQGHQKKAMNYAHQIWNHTITYAGCVLFREQHAVNPKSYT